MTENINMPDGSYPPDETPGEASAPDTSGGPPHLEGSSATPQGAPDGEIQDALRGGDGPTDKEQAEALVNQALTRMRPPETGDREPEGETSNEPGEHTPTVEEAMAAGQNTKSGTPSEHGESPKIKEQQKREIDLGLKLMDQDLNAGELINTLNELNVSKEDTPGVLKDFGKQSDERIAEVMALADELTGEEMSQEEKDKPLPETTLTEEEVGKEVDELDVFRQHIADKKPGEKITEEEKGRIGKAHDRFQELLFNEETGVLRKGERFRRLFVKPAVTGLIAALIAYAAALHAITKSTTTRVGGH